MNPTYSIFNHLGLVTVGAIGTAYIVVVGKASTAIIKEITDWTSH